MKIIKDGFSKKIPDFLIVGAAKSGTTSLHYYLNEHPSVFLPAVKESYFFTFRHARPSYASPDPLFGVVSEDEEYFRLYDGATDGQIIGDASPSYLYAYDTTIKNIKELYGKEADRLKIIILLRNPVERAYSQYMMFRREKAETLPFDKAIQEEVIRERMAARWNMFYDYLGFGLYYNQVRAYLENFRHVRIILFSELNNNPFQVMEQVCDFLEISRLPSLSPMKYNKSGVPKSALIHEAVMSPSILKRMIKPLMPESLRLKLRYKIFELNLEKPPMDQEVKNRMIEFYRDDVAKLETLIDRQFHSWLN